MSATCQICQSIDTQLINQSSNQASRQSNSQHESIKHISQLSQVSRHLIPQTHHFLRPSSGSRERHKAPNFAATAGRV